MLSSTLSNDILRLGQGNRILVLPSGAGAGSAQTEVVAVGGGQPSPQSRGEPAFLEQSKAELLCAALRPLAAKWGPSGVFIREADSVVGIVPA